MDNNEDFQYYTYLYAEPRLNDFDRIVPFYVGKGKGDRFKQHQLPKGAHNKTVTGHIRNIRAKGLEPFIQKSHYRTEQEAIAMEITLIKIYGRRDQGTGTLFNHTDGGDGVSGHRHSESTKRLISEKNKGRIPWNKGRKMAVSPEGLVAIRNNAYKVGKLRKGKATSDKQKEAVRRANLRRKGKPVQYTEEHLEAIRASNRRRRG